MKKIFAIIMAAMLVMALSVTAFAAEATVSTTFTCNFSDNDYDTAITGGSLSGDNVEIDGTWGGSFPNITPLIETVAPLADVTHIVVTVKASNMDACWNSTPQKLELHWNTRDNNEDASTVEFDADGVAVVEADVPAGVNAVVLNPYAFASAAGDITFEVTVAVTGNFEAPEAPAAEEEAPVAPEAEAEAPAPAPEAAPAAPAAPATGLALAVVPAVMALAAAYVSKKH